MRLSNGSSGKVQENANSKKLEAKIRSIKGLSSKALTKKIEEMYPKIFNRLEKLTEEHHIHKKRKCNTCYSSSKKNSSSLTRLTQKRIGYFGKKRFNKKN